MRALTALCYTALISLTAPAVAQEVRNAVVVELFTSQGCSACPPADAMMGELSGRDDVIALSLHVDYWDYIGWADTFATPQYTARQQGYGHAAGSTVVYTPQVIVGGQDRVVGFRPMSVADLIQAHQNMARQVTLSVRQAGDRVTVDASADMPPPRPTMVIQIVAFAPHRQVEITRGERAGSVSDHYNVVTSWQIVSEWDGSEPFSTEIAPEADVPHVVIVQEAGFGPILAAARIN